MKAFHTCIHRLRRAQSLSEYVLLVGIAAAALIAMSTYMQRGVQSVVKLQADELGSQKGLVDEPNNPDNPYGAPPDYIESQALSASSTDTENTVNEITGGARSTSYDESHGSSGESSSMQIQYRY